MRVEVGTHESLLLGANRDFAAALVEAGADVETREYEGGHDYACWRGGLLTALIDLSAPRA